MSKPTLSNHSRVLGLISWGQRPLRCPDKDEKWTRRGRKTVLLPTSSPLFLYCMSGHLGRYPADHYPRIDSKQAFKT